MRSMKKGLACLIALAITTGCASTTVSDQQQAVTGYIPRPEIPITEIGVRAKSMSPDVAAAMGFIALLATTPPSVGRSASR